MNCISASDSGAPTATVTSKTSLLSGRVPASPEPPASCPSVWTRGSPATLGLSAWDSAATVVGQAASLGSSSLNSSLSGVLLPNPGREAKRKSGELTEPNSPESRKKPGSRKAGGWAEAGRIKRECPFSLPLFGPGMLVHTYVSRHFRGGDQEDQSSRPVWAKS
jgi:hypothetical protein